MNSMKKLVVSVIAAIAASSAAHADPLKATVIHWWTSGGESAAIKQFADAYNKAGGLWIDQAVAGADQARSTAINRIMGGDPPTAAQFNTSKQFHDIIDQGLLNNVDDVAAKQNWDKIFPASIMKASSRTGTTTQRPWTSTCRPGSSIRSRRSRRPASRKSRPRTMSSSRISTS